ncbi:hypothetical protein BJ875DRAFT_381149 [Amylocarpus encephaloides]|uniref:Uncharacterized protein n=1 Tax=Amylocarpus encephaloides TaxID=45428 RepID=A0A9P8C390_9HELO|nr:hypothetical protein BJ875DRAFT_381149 [Amylocarpus encephaloides]
MGASQGLSLALGVLAVSSDIALLTFDIIFAAGLPKSSLHHLPRTAAVIASSLTGVDLIFLSLLLGRQVRYRNGGHIQDFGHGRRYTYIIAGFSGTVGILSTVASALLFATARVKIQYITHPSIISMNLISGGFVVWALTLPFQTLFVICVIVLQRQSFQHPVPSYRGEPSEAFPEMQEESRAEAQMVQASIGHRARSSMVSRTPPSSSGRSRAGSDTMSSFRSSFSQVVRPITSKTRLIQVGHKSPHRPTSIASTHGDASMEDGFDSWDTSAVDAQSRKAVESISPTPQRFLETIPASPTGSRSPSPGFPLDLEPPKPRKRSRSYSPANSPKDRERFKGSRTTSPTESTAEAHIHPLFRTDSPTPPPAATPGTIVTAAPNAGQVIPDRQSIRSIHRMRSGSLPASPLSKSPSLESIRRGGEREELEHLEAGGERTLTPPIPDFILNGGPRNSLSGYNSRKKSQAGLSQVGDARDA